MRGKEETRRYIGINRENKSCWDCWSERVEKIGWKNFSVWEWRGKVALLSWKWCCGLAIPG